MTAVEVKQKIQDRIDKLCKGADEEGASHLAVCNFSNWDREEWNYRNDIISTVRKRGYKVETKTNFGVLDIVVTKELTFS